MLKKVLVSVATVAALGAAGISVAGAETITDASSPAATAPAVAEDDAPMSCEQGNRRSGKHGNKRQRRAEVVKAAAAAIGIDAEALTSAMKSGQSIAQVADANGVDASAVVDALVNSAEEKLEALVDSGKLDDAKAAKLKQRLPDLFERLVNRARGATAPATEA